MDGDGLACARAGPRQVLLQPPCRTRGTAFRRGGVDRARKGFYIGHLSRFRPASSFRPRPAVTEKERSPMSNRDSSASDVLMAFLIGGATGAALALLFAPRSGEDTREM